MRSAYVLLVLAISLSLSVAEHAVKSHSKTWLKDLETPVLLRQRRQVSGMTTAEIRQALDHHNTLRASEGANNMERMVFNTVQSLTNRAYFWLRTLLLSNRIESHKIVLIVLVVNYQIT